MRPTAIVVWVITSCSLLCGAKRPSPAVGQRSAAASAVPAREAAVQPVTHGDITAVILAIKDEIYGGGCAPVFADIGTAVGQGDSVHQINVYFERSSHDGYSWVVYKFWPFGEVYRMYWIDKAGLAHLAGHPDWGFPPTEPSYLTIYMGDRELSHLKSTWERVPLDIRISPSAERIREAERRQVKRGGDLHVCRGRWQGNIFIPQE